MAGSTVKMGVDVTQFKQGMRDAQNSVKTLDQELKRSEAQYKATGDKEKYMSEQTRLLKQKLEEQKTAAKNAQKALDEMRKNGVQQTSNEYQTMARQLAAAQTGMYNTEAALNSLNDAQVKTAQSANELNTNVEGIGKKLSLQQVQSGLKSIDDMLKSAASSALQIGKNIVSSVTDTAGWADDLLTNSVIYGIDQDTLQKWDRAATHFDVTLEALVKSRQKLAQNMKYGREEVMDACEELGVSPYKAIVAGGKTEEAKRELKGIGDFIWEVGEKLAAMDRDDPNTEGLAMKLLGRNWSELLPLFTQGRDAYEQFMGTVSTVDEETVQNAAGANEAIDALQYEWQVTTRELSGSLAPALTEISNILQGVLKEFNDYLKTDEGKAKMKELTDAVTNLFQGLKGIKADDVLDTAKNILDGIVNALTWIANNWQEVEAGIRAIAGAWIALKVTEGVTAMINLVNGLSGLGAGSAAAAGASYGSSWGGGFATAALAAIVKAVPWLAGLAVWSQGVWDENYVGSTEDKDYYKDVVTNLYDGAEITDAAVETYMNLTELGATAEEVATAMEEFGLTMKKEVTEQREKDQEKRDWRDEMQGAGLYEAVWLKSNTNEYRRLQEYWDKYRTGTSTNEDWANLMNYFSGGNHNGYDMTSMTRVLQRMYSLDRSLEDLPNEVFGLDANLNLTDDAQEILQGEADGLKPVSVPGVISLGFGRDNGGGENGGSAGFANGLWSVPWDGYPAILHKGERVLTARENRQYTYNNNTYFGSVNLNNGMEIDALSESIARQNRRHNAGYGT